MDLHAYAALFGLLLLPSATQLSGPIQVVVCRGTSHTSNAT